MSHDKYFGAGESVQRPPIQETYINDQTLKRFYMRARRIKRLALVALINSRQRCVSAAVRIKLFRGAVIDAPTDSEASLSAAFASLRSLLALCLLASV